MNFNGEIVFAITDDNPIEVDFGEDMLPTRIIDKDDRIALGMKAPKYRWMYEFAQIGYSLPDYILKKVSSLGCSLHFDILSFGMAT